MRLLPNSRFTINDHKNKKRYKIPPVVIPSETPLQELLKHFTGWAQELIFIEEFGCDSVAQSEGAAFFNAQGKPYTLDGFYTKLKSLIKDVCGGDDKINIGIRLLRHLLSDSDLYATDDVSKRTSISFLSGHSLQTEARFYKTPSPSSKKLTDAAAFCFEKQAEAVKRRKEEEAQEKEEGDETAASLGGKPVVHRPSPRARLLPREEVLEMTGKEKKRAFQSIFGVSTDSGNQAWLFSKLTGLPITEFVSPRKRPRVDFDIESD